MSKMPGMNKPKAKNAPRKKKPRPRPRCPATKKPVMPASQKPTPSPSPAHVMTTGMQMPSASPSASPPHVMTPGMQMPSASPSPSSPHQMTPGMQMSTAPAVQPMQEPGPALRDDLPEGPASSRRSMNQTSEHGVFVEQTIPLVMVGRLGSERCAPRGAQLDRRRH